MFLTAAAGAQTAAITDAVAPRWGEEPLAYTVIDQDLRDLLKEIGNTVGVPVVQTDAVKGRVRGRLQPGTARETLDRLASMYGFNWFFDGAAIQVSSASELAGRLMVLGPVTGVQLDASLRELGVQQPRWPVRQTGNLAMVSGPPRYVALVEQVLGAIVQQQGHGRSALPVQPDGGRAMPAPLPASGAGWADTRVFRGKLAERQ